MIDGGECRRAGVLLRRREFVVFEQRQSRRRLQWGDRMDPRGKADRAYPSTGGHRECLYLQSWDVPDLFVVGASAFSQISSFNSTGTVNALAYLTADTIKSKHLENPGPYIGRECRHHGAPAAQAGVTPAAHLAVIARYWPEPRQHRAASPQSHGAPKRP